MFDRIRKDELVKVLKPLEDKNTAGLRNTADQLDARGDVEQSAVAEVIRGACELMENYSN